jgi:mRNA interferase RelE/StbE
VSYTVLGLSGIERELSRLRKKDYEKKEAAILGLGEDPRPANCQKMKGRDAWRIRVGEYRVIYEIRDQARIVTILDVGHRKEIYR